MTEEEQMEGLISAGVDGNGPNPENAEWDAMYTYEHIAEGRTYPRLATETETAKTKEWAEKVGLPWPPTPTPPPEAPGAP